MQCGEVSNRHAKRWTIDPEFCDRKDRRIGMGTSRAWVGRGERRDPLFAISAFAIALLKLLESAGENPGYDRRLKSNTAKKRTHSLFPQGYILDELITNRPAEELRPLLERFTGMRNEHRAFTVF